MSEPSADVPTDKTGRIPGPWRKGESGNVKGRPPGARNRSTVAAETLLDGQARGLTQACINRALAGDSVALRLCLERILPPRKDRPIRVGLPPIVKAADVPQALAAVLESVSVGELTPDEGVRLAQVIEQIRKSIETAELENRIARLEQRVPGGQSEIQQKA